MYLIYINEVGSSWDGDNIYEFLFSETKEDIDGEFWDKIPAGGNPEPPKSVYVDSVGKLITDNLIFDLVQDSDTFAMWDAVDGLIALGWENMDEYEVYPDVRLHFNFGDTLESVVSSLLKKDNALIFSNENLIKKEDGKED